MSGTDFTTENEKQLLECLQLAVKIIVKLADRIYGGLTEDGGEGSGNFGHEGRPGEVGGSGGGGATKSAGQKTGAEEKQRKINSVKIDFSRDNTLPGLNKEDLEGKPDKPVLLKKNIIERNMEHHYDISKEEFQKMLGEALYSPDAVIPEKVNPQKPNYRHFIKYLPRDNSVVIIDLSDAKENYEVVHVQKMRAKSTEKLKNKNK